MAPFGDLHKRNILLYSYIKSTMPLSAALDSFRNSAASACLPLGLFNDAGYKGFEPELYSLAMCLWAGYCNLCANLSRTSKPK